MGAPKSFLATMSGHVVLAQGLALSSQRPFTLLFTLLTFLPFVAARGTGAGQERGHSGLICGFFWGPQLPSQCPHVCFYCRGRPHLAVLQGSYLMDSGNYIKVFRIGAREIAQR